MPGFHSTAYGRHQRSRGVRIGGSADLRRRKRKEREKRGRESPSGRSTPARDRPPPRPHTVNSGDVRDRADVLRHAFREEAMGLSHPDAHGGLLSGELGDQGPSRKRSKLQPFASLDAHREPTQAIMPSAHAAIASQADAQLGMGQSRADFGHGHAMQGGAQSRGIPSPIAEMPTYEDSAGIVDYPGIDQDYSRHTSPDEEAPIELGISATDVPVVQTGAGPGDSGFEFASWRRRLHTTR